MRLIKLLRRYVFTRENAWVLIIALMLLFLFILGTIGSPSHFVYGGF